MHAGRNGTFQCRINRPSGFLRSDFRRFKLISPCAIAGRPTELEMIKGALIIGREWAAGALVGADLFGKRFLLGGVEAFSDHGKAGDQRAAEALEAVAVRGDGCDLAGEEIALHAELIAQRIAFRRFLVRDVDILRQFDSHVRCLGDQMIVIFHRLHQFVRAGSRHGFGGHRSRQEFFDRRHSKSP